MMRARFESMNSPGKLAAVKEGMDIDSAQMVGWPESD